MIRQSNSKANKVGWDGASYGNSLGYRMFLFCLRIFGVRAAYAMLVPVALYYCLRIKEEHRRSVRKFATLYNKWRLRKTRLRYSYHYQRIYCFGQILIDRLLVMSLKENRFQLHKSGIKNLAALAREGGILLSCHMGNWEMGLPILQSEPGVQAHVAMVVLKSDPLYRFTQLSKVLTILPISPGEDIAFILKNALQSGKIVAMHGDRFLPGARTIAVDFMGEPAHFPVGPYIVAASLQKPLAFVLVIKTGALSYELCCSKPRVYCWDKQQSREAQLRAWLEEYVRFLELYIAQYPQQWFNFYDFWQPEREEV